MFKNIIYFYIYSKNLYLKIKRSSFWRRYLISSTISFIISLLNVVVLILLGKEIGVIIPKLFPHKNVITFVDNYLIIFILITYSIRYLFDNSLSSDVKPYLNLPFPKNKLAKIIIIKSIFNYYSIAIIIFSISFYYNYIRFNYGLYSLFWVSGVILIIALAEMTYIILKQYSYIHPLKTTITIFSVYILYIIIDIYFSFNPLNDYNFLNIILYNHTFIPILFLLPLLLLLTHSGYKFIRYNLYLDQFIIYKRSSFSNILNLNKLEDYNPFFFLQFKLIKRNKLLINYFTQGLLLFCISTVTSIVLSEAKLFNYLLITIFFALSSIGYIFIAAYEQNIFGWESHYLDLYFVRQVNIKKYIYAKIRFIQFCIIVFTLFNICLFQFLDKAYLALVISISAYSLGVISITLSYHAIFNYHPMHPDIGINLNMSNLKNPKKSFMILFGFYPVFVLFLFMGTNSTINNNYYIALSIITITGLLGLIFQKWFIAHLIKLFKNKRYSLIEKTLTNDSL